MVVGVVFLIIFALIAIASFAFGEKTCVDLVKDKRSVLPLNEYKRKIEISLIVFVISFTLMLYFIFLARNYSPSWDEYLKCFVGGLAFASCISVGTFSFTIHYYCKKLDKDIDKKLFRMLIICVALITPSLFVGADAFANVCGDKFLLPNGINFSHGFVSPKDWPNTPNIAFYALCILFGAVFVYVLNDHYHYKKYGKHGLIDSTFLIAFPAGILGARIAYVIGEWNTSFAARFAKGEWWSIFAIWEGGLTILGGAIGGIVVGVLWYMHANKGKSIWWAIDTIVPSILIAQAFGRWGNFFNCEVHGGLVPEEYWRWIPNFIFNNAHFTSSTHTFAPDGYLYAPLFLIEGMINMLGYFVIAHLFGKKFVSLTKPGDLAFSYLIWYGFTRVFMEPLRASSFNMGSNGYWSWFWSIIFVAVGSIAIVTNHIVRKLKCKDDSYVCSIKNNIIGLSVFSLLGIALLVVGIILMSSNSFTQTISYNGFNIGVICLVSGISLVLFDIIPTLNLVYKNK